jgi:hydrogenase maturation protein HypF
MPVALERLRVEIRGVVQGVGFRPFVYRLAGELRLSGWVVNDTRGVFIEVEGSRPDLERFIVKVEEEKPPRAIIHTIDSAWLEPAGFREFEIRHSDEQGEKSVSVLPEVATCDPCRAEVMNPADRRHRYPFTNCTNCGPRFSIIRALPYDRPNTTMRGFTMCEKCQSEYENPLDRRFHAQPNACPVCGPQLALWDRSGAVVDERDGALTQTARALLDGKIVAVKGLGGFHLMTDARNADAIARLRQRKPRMEKPFAVMARDLEQARTLCELTKDAEALLTSPEAPILLLPRRKDAPIAEIVAPGFPTLGVMLAYTPLHHLLLEELGVPVVATSGNLTDEPIATDEREAVGRLGDIADLFLIHDRPIERHIDDSVGWFIDNGFTMLRRARGYAPLPVRVKNEWPAILAVGAHLKSTVALSVGNLVFLSQHIGDLETPEAMDAFEQVIADFLRLYEAEPVAVAHDLHPNYLSTQWARDRAAERSLRLIPVQHHHAHLAAALAENGEDGPALGITWDGTGFGTDGTVWGGEFLFGDAGGFERVAHLRSFRLPGGEAAVHEPRRAALSLLWETLGESVWERSDLAPVAAFDESERGPLSQMLRRGLNAPVTTSAGRLFDGVAALLGLHQRANFEGQAAMALEFAADPNERGSYPLPLLTTEEDSQGWVLDWGPLVTAVIDDLQKGTDRGIIAARFHNGLVSAAAEVAAARGEELVALSGGCFQNRFLTEHLVSKLGEKGHRVLLHRQVPPNDGGISLGQVAVAAATLSRE